MYLLNTDEHKHENVVETRDRDSADSSKFNTDNLCILNTRSHTHTHTEVSKLGQSPS